MEGHALKKEQVVPVAQGDGKAGRRVAQDRRPPLTGERSWEIEVVPGPNDDWIDAAGHTRFLSSDWTLQARSNRTGYRLEGPGAQLFSRIAGDFFTILGLPLLPLLAFLRGHGIGVE